MREKLLAIAHSGLLAPSADNLHVFRIELGETFIVLWPSSEFQRCTDNLRRVLGLISLGAVTENMRLRASEVGLQAHIRWHLDWSTKSLARLDFRESLLPSDELAQAISRRHTNRRMYRGPSLTEDECRRLSDSNLAAAGVDLVWLHGGARARAMRLAWAAESERFLRRHLHEDLFSSIRFDLGWHESANTSIPPGALEIEAPMRPMFKALGQWSLMKPMARLGLHRLLGLRAAWLPCWQAPALGLLTTKMELQAGAVAVGAALERLWLRATCMGLAVQPMAASVVLPLQTDAIDGASAGLKSKLAAGWQAVAPDSTPLMLFRMGRAKAPTVVSGRPPLEDMLISAGKTADWTH